MIFIKRALVPFSLLLLLLLPVVLEAQSPPAPEVIVIRAGRLFDSEKGIFQPARTIVVKGNLIESVGENIPVPAGARVIDLSRYTVLPGLVDAHTHLLYLEDPSAGLSNEGIKGFDGGRNDLAGPAGSGARSDLSERRHYHGA